VRGTKTITIIALAAAMAAMPATAQMHGMDHSTLGHGQMMKATPANAFPQSEMAMHEKMMGAVGADATETWVRKMIEHHRGGVAMSQIVLRDTKDAQVRSMATRTIAMQQKEAGELNAWLRNLGKRAQ
jgi:uncharacterized protein (DUF305 family)